MKKIFVSVILTLLFPLIMLAQSENSDCSKLKNGTFYLYMPSYARGFIINRNDTLQEEINLKTNDSSYWKVSWQSDCEFSLQFIRKTIPLTDKEKPIYNSKVVYCRILKIKKDYYKFKAGAGSVDNPKVITGKMWFKPK